MSVRTYDYILVDVGRKDVARPVIEEVRRYPAETVALLVTGPGADVSSIDALREGAVSGCGSRGPGATIGA